MLIFKVFTIIGKNAFCVEDSEILKYPWNALVLSELPLEIRQGLGVTNELFAGLDKRVLILKKCGIGGRKRNRFFSFPELFSLLPMLCFDLLFKTGFPALTLTTLESSYDGTLGFQSLPHLLRCNCSSSVPKV